MAIELVPVDSDEDTAGFELVAPDGESAPSPPAGGEPDNEGAGEPSFADTAIEAARRFNVGLTQALGIRPFTRAVGIADDARPGAPDLGAVGGGMEALGAGAGFGTALLGGGALAARGAATLGGRTAQGGAERVLTSALETTARSPVGVASAEAASSFLSGVGGDIGEDAGGPAGRVFGETAGGLTPAGGALAVSGIEKLSPIVRAARNLVNPVAGVSDAQMDSAAQRVGPVVPQGRRVLDDAQGADVIPQAREPRTSVFTGETRPLLTTGELAQSPGLMSLEKSIVDKSEELTLDRDQRFAEINSLIRTGLDQFTSEDAGGRVEPDVAADYLRQLVDTRIEQARASAQNALDRVGPQRSRDELSSAAQKELDEALEVASVQEDELYANVPREMPAPAKNAIENMRAFLSEVNSNRAEQEFFELDPRIARLLGRINKKGKFKPGKYKEGTSVKELHSLRSHVLRLGREERAKKGAADRGKLRFYGILQESLLNDLNEIPEVNDTLTVARKFSQDLNQKFRQGTVGRILGFDRDGGKTIEDVLTLEKTLGRPGREGRVKADDLLVAVGDTPEMRSIMQDYLLDEFLRASKSGGEFNPRAAATYINRRQDVLDLFPELRGKLQEAIDSGSALTATTNMMSRNKSATGLVLQARPGREMAALMNAGGSRGAQSARELMGELSRDPSGRATLGFQQALIDEIYSRAGQRMAAPDVQGNPFVGGGKLRDLVNDRSVRPIINEILSPDQRRRLDQIANTAARLDSSRHAKGSPEAVLALKEPFLSNIIRRVSSAVLGGRIAQRFGVLGNVQTPGIVVGAIEKLAQRGLDPARELISRAVVGGDDELLELLLKRTGKVTQEEVDQHLGLWAMESAREYGFSLTEEPQQEEQQQ